MEKKFWTVPKKVILVIMLAIWASWMFGGSHPLDKSIDLPKPMASNGDIDTAYLQKLYVIYNDQYFDNRLTKTPEINVELNSEDMADTQCDDSAADCEIRFNLHYTAAPRVAQQALLHEMCHIRNWSKNLPQDRPAFMDQKAYDHNRGWRTCMLALDAAGAFRQINIDYYREEVR
jgi:hypothetical protein